MTDHIEMAAIFSQSHAQGEKLQSWDSVKLLLTYLITVN